MLRAILIDDEELAIDNLRYMLTQYCPQIEIISTWTDSTDGLTAIQTQKPDVVFLDVKMPRLSGFHVLDRFADIPLSVIFVTGHDEFAQRAFRYSAVDFLIKPIIRAELVEAVTKAQKQAVLSDRQIAHLRQQFVKPELAVNDIMLPYQNGFIPVNLRDILYCKAIDNYTIFHVIGEQQYLKTKSLKIVEEILQDRDFVRVHKSFLVNMLHVKRFIKGEQDYLLLTDSSKINVSRGYKDRLYHRYGWL